MAVPFHKVSQSDLEKIGRKEK